MSKLKPVDTKNPDEFRQHLKRWNSLAAMSDLDIPESDIEEMVRLHCEEGLSLEECVERMVAGDLGEANKTEH